MAFECEQNVEKKKISNKMEGKEKISPATKLGIRDFGDMF